MTLELMSEHEAMVLLAETEARLGEIYRAYAGLYAEDAAFYAKLAKDEQVHARWVRSLIPRVAQGLITFREGRFLPEMFTAFRDYMVRRLQEAQTAPPSRLDALAIAVDAESTLIERNFYEVFASDDPEAAHTLRILSHSADAHQRITRERWQLAQL